jgi:nucleoside-diphosphate-sugar epimerase
MKLEDVEVLITGGTGFIGSHLVRDLVGRGARVSVLTRRGSNPWRLRDVLDDIKIVYADITKFEETQKIVRQICPEKVYHLAAYVDVGRGIDRLQSAIKVNLQGTLNLLRSLQDVDFNCFVNAGTVEEYGTNPVPFKETMREMPVSPYSASKVATTHFCQMLYRTQGMPIVVVRPFLTYGPFQDGKMLIPSLIQSCLEKKNFEMTKGEQTREFNYVEDIVEGFILASVHKKALGEVINLGNGKEYSVREVAVMINEMFGNPIKLLFGAKPYRKTEIWRIFCDNSKAKRLLRWRPRHSLEEGLKKTVEWYKSEKRRSS